MQIRSFESADLSALHHILTSNHWDYFLDPTIDERGLEVRNENYFSSETTCTLVYLGDDNVPVGFIHFDGIKNTSGDYPSFTLCVDQSARGKGIGTQLLQAGVKYIFEHYDKIRRIYATTRADNIPMQKTFESVGFRQEARYVKEWENRETGEFLDSWGYALLREEFGN